MQEFQASLNEALQNSTNSLQSSESQQQRAEALQQKLDKLQIRLLTLQNQLLVLQNRSAEQEKRLNDANESFEQYAKEEKRTRLRLKKQRNSWEAVSGLLAIVAAMK